MLTVSSFIIQLLFLLQLQLLLLTYITLLADTLIQPVQCALTEMYYAQLSPCRQMLVCVHVDVNCTLQAADRETICLKCQHRNEWPVLYVCVCVCYMTTLRPRGPMLKPWLMLLGRVN